jgi:hypothetical protein
MKSDAGSSLKGRDVRETPSGGSLSGDWTICKSSGLEIVFSQLLKSEKPNLLDIGAVSGSSIQYLASLGCRVYADNILELGFSGRLPYESQFFHGILIWEAADMLDTATAEKFLKEVKRVLKLGGVAFLISASRKKDQTEKAMQFKIKKRDTFEYSFQEDILLKKYFHSNRDLMKMLHHFQILTFNLLKTGKREIVIKKEKGK